MSHVQLSDVQLTNLTMLLTIRDGMQRDSVATCCKFALDQRQAERLSELNATQILSFVTNLGEATLFPPRRDLLDLLVLPLPLTRPLATVHGAVPASVSPTGERT